MYKGPKMLAMLLGTVMGIALFIGCGKTESTAAIEQKEYVYVPTFSKLELENENDSINNTVQYGKYLYCIGMDYSQEMPTTDFYKIDVATGEQQRLNIEVGSESYIQQICVNQEGNLFCLTNTYNMETEQSIFQGRLYSGEDGSLMTEVDLSQAQENPDGYIQSIAIDGAGNIYLVVDGDKVVILDAAGKKTGEISVSNYVQQMFTGADGTVYIMSYGNSGMGIFPLDAAAKSIGNEIKDILGPNDYNAIFAQTTDGKTLISTSSAVRLCDLESGTGEELFNWLDSDVNADNVSAFGLLEDGRVWALENTYAENGSKLELVLLTRTKASEISEKIQLTYGGIYVDSTIKKEIIDFNKTNGTYRISVKEYVTDDYDTGVTQFNADIAGGNGPDIIDFSNMATAEYASKGLLEDLYPYLDQDEELNREDYLENILQAYESEGKLYTIPSFFYIRTLVGNTKRLEGITSWTPEEMIAYAQTHCQDGATLFASDKSSALYTLMSVNAKQFIDWDTGKCSFNSPDFLDILNFSNTFPKEYTYSGEKGEGTHAKLESGQVLLMDTSISSVQEHQMMEGMLGGEITYVGYPMMGENNGNIIYSFSSMPAISAKSQNKDGAWAFLRRFYTQEYQEDTEMMRGFPIMKAALDQVLADSMEKEYDTDANGEKVERIKTSWGYDDFNMDIYAASREQVDAVKAVIESADTVMQYDSTVFNMVSEETEAFFEGQKTAQETADVIQSRIQIYVDEHR